MRGHNHESSAVTLPNVLQWETSGLRSLNLLCSTLRIFRGQTDESVLSFLTASVFYSPWPCLCAGWRGGAVSYCYAVEVNWMCHTALWAPDGGVMSPGLTRPSWLASRPHTLLWDLNYMWKILSATYRFPAHSPYVPANPCCKALNTMLTHLDTLSLSHQCNNTITLTNKYSHSFLFKCYSVQVNGFVSNICQQGCSLGNGNPKQKLSWNVSMTLCAGLMIQ